MKVKLFAVLFIATASFQNFEATDLSLLQHFMENELPPQAGYPLLGDSNPGDKDTTELPKSLICPREIKVSWQLKPPFTLQNYSKEDQPQVNGILHQALKFALERCCAYYRGNKTTMRYLTMSDNSSALQRTALTEDISLSFPFQKDWYIGSRRRYINVFDSPGIVIIRRVSPTKRRAELLKAILGAWPIVVLSLLLSSLAGICIWTLVSPHLYLKQHFATQLGSFRYKSLAADVEMFWVGPENEIASYLKIKTQLATYLKGCESHGGFSVI